MWPGFRGGYGRSGATSGTGVDRVGSRGRSGNSTEGLGDVGPGWVVEGGVNGENLA